MREKKIRRLQLRLTDSVYEKLRVLSNDRGISVSQLIEDIVNDEWIRSLDHDNVLLAYHQLGFL